MEKEKRVLIVDGHNLFIRNYVVVPTMDTNGSPVGGITGFMKSLKNLVSDVKPTRVIVVWDGEGGSRRKRGIYSDYKAGRKVRLNREHDLETQSESFGNMHVQMKKLMSMLELIGVVQVVIDDVEADDVIAFTCKTVIPEVEKVIVTSDRDMLQLLDNKTLVYSPSKKIYWTRSDLLENVGVTPENYIYVKALVGDKSDNVKGIQGIGEKTAVKLFPFLAEASCDLEMIRRHAETNKAKSPKYSNVLGEWEKVLENVKIMQLSSPVISTQAARTIRDCVKVTRPKFMFTELKLELTRHGIQNIDVDFFVVFKTFKNRAEGEDV